MCLIVRQLPIKARWWDAAFALLDFSRSSKQFCICSVENLDLSSLKSRPIMTKISTYDDENLDRSSWKSRSFVMKSSPFVKKINLKFYPEWRSISSLTHQSKSICKLSYTKLYSELRQISKIKLWKNSWRLQVTNDFSKKLHPTCFTKFLICFWYTSG